MSPRRGKTTATVLVLLACGSVVVAIVNWRAFVTEYHVYRLRRDPHLLDTVMSNPADSLEEAALFKYLRTAHGQRRLADKFLDGLFAFLAHQDPDFLPRSLSTGQIVAYGLYWIGERRFFLIDGPRTIAKPIGDSPGIRRLEPFLQFINHGEYEFSELPGIKLTIRAYTDDLNQNEIVVEGWVVRTDGVSTAADRS